MPRRSRNPPLTKTAIKQAVYSGNVHQRSGGGEVSDRCVLWDGEVSGFGVRIHPSGRKTFIVRYRAGRRRRLMSLGEVGVLHLNEARERARKVLIAVIDGADPITERQRARMSTVETLCASYQEHQRGRIKPLSMDALRVACERITETLGHVQTDRLTRADVMRAHEAWTRKAGPAAANNTLRHLGGAFSYAQENGLIQTGKNPAHGVKPNPSNERGRYLTGEEMERLGSAIAEQERSGKTAPESIAVIRLLCLTGARKQEIARLRWSEMDLAAGCLRLKDSKTGAKVIPLGEPALEILRTVPRRPGAFVFPGRKGGGIRCEVAWQQIRERAGLEDLRLHDLRHVYASLGANLGLSLFLVGKILGHSTEYMTERYSHEQIDPQRATADTISARISAALKGER